MAARLVGNDGVERPGMFFLRSDCNDPVLSLFGNRLTEFRFHYFHTSAISLYRRDRDLLAGVETRDKGGDLVLHLADEGPMEATPPADGFVDAADEKRCLVELFHAYAADEQLGVVYDMEIERGDWRPTRLRLVDGFSAFFEEGPFTPATARPVSHLYIRECAYVWKPTTRLPLSSLRRRANVPPP